jgi:hypothetical protein
LIPRIRTSLDAAALRQVAHPVTEPTVGGSEDKGYTQYD